jgi:hypothetical protein
MTSENQKLSQAQKNQVFRLIRDFGLNPMNFTWSEFIYETGTIIGYGGMDYTCNSLHRNDEFYFRFCRSGTAFGYDPEFCPGGISRTTKKENLNWSQTLEAVTKWLSLLKSELEEPDFWAQTVYSITPLGIIEDAERQFSTDEFAKLESILQNMKRELTLKLNLNQEQNERLNFNVDYLVSEARKQPIRSWFFLFLGTMLSCILTLPVTADKVPLFWQVIKLAIEPAKTLLGIK